MFDFLKICGMGLLYTLLSPLFLVVFVLYLLWATLIFIFNLGRGIVLFFRGVNIIKRPLKEDLEAQKILQERKLMVQNPMGMPSYNQPTNNPYPPTNQVQPGFNPNFYNQNNQMPSVGNPNSYPPTPNYNAFNNGQPYNPQPNPLDINNGGERHD